MLAKVDWCGSQEVDFSVSDNETKIYSVSTYSYDTLAMFATLTIVALHLFLVHYFHFGYLIWGVVLSLIFMVYMVSIGRNKYLEFTALS